MAEAGAILALASAVPLVLLGAGLLLVWPYRREQMFLALAALLWGTQVALANFGRALDDPALHERLLLISYVPYVVCAAYLTHAIVLATGSRRGVVWSFLTMSLAIGAVITAVFWPESLLRGVEPGPAGRGLVTRTGSLYTMLVPGPFYLALYICLGLLYRAYRRAPVGTMRHRMRGLLSAFLLFVVYSTVSLLFNFLGSTSTLSAAPVSALGLQGLFFGGTVFLIGLFAHLMVFPVAPEGRDFQLALAFLVPAAVAVLEPALATVGLPLSTLGLWRIAMVAVLVHTVARHQLFDLDIRLKRLAGPVLAALALGFGALAAVTLSLAGHGAGIALVPFGLGAVVGGASIAGREFIGERLFPGVSDSPDYVYQRKVEVYRAAMEAGTASAELTALRRRLGLGEREHQLLSLVVGPRTPTSTPAPRAAPGARVMGRYRVDRLLGEGGYGRTYLAFDERDGREVAVKVVGRVALGGAASRALLSEAQALRKVEHPHVIRMLDVEDGADETALVMEYADGGSLDGLLRRKGTLPEAEAVRIAREVLDGLHAAHEAGIVHRDVKPENILLLKDGSVKVADFGIARVDDGGPAATAAAAPVGTLLYMSPEQVRGTGVDARSDLYAVGVLLHLMVTGRHCLPIAGRDDFQVRELILRAKPDLALAPPSLLPALERALAKDPDARFPDAAAMRAALAR